MRNTIEKSLADQIKTYSRLIELCTFESRFNYLSLQGIVGDPTFGGHRQLNQILYSCDEWKTVRRQVIIRDDGCDLGILDRPIRGKIMVHHINPITIDDVLDRRACVFDLDNLICCSMNTHNAIHYGDDKILVAYAFAERKPGDTCPWR